MNTKKDKTTLLFNEVDDLRKRINREIRDRILSKGTDRLDLTLEEEDDIFVIVYNWDGEPIECRVTAVSTDPGTEYSLTVHSVEKHSLAEMTSRAPYELGATNPYWLIEILERIDYKYGE